MAEIQSSFRRVEKKFVLTEKEYEILLPVITQHMVSDQYGEYTICNIYYDTDSYELIRKSIEKPVYKEKFRVRSYGVPSDTDMIFAEIKKKYKGVVYKRRVADEYTKVSAFVRNEDPLEQDFQIQNEIKNFMDRYHPVPRYLLPMTGLPLRAEREKIFVLLLTGTSVFAQIIWICGKGTRENWYYRRRELSWK